MHAVSIARLDGVLGALCIALTDLLHLFPVLLMKTGVVMLALVKPGAVFLTLLAMGVVFLSLLSSGCIHLPEGLSLEPIGKRETSGRAWGGGTVGARRSVTVHLSLAGEAIPGPSCTDVDKLARCLPMMMLVVRMLVESTLVPPHPPRSNLTH